VKKRKEIEKRSKSENKLRRLVALHPMAGRGSVGRDMPKS
jgi:hypothetical protein